MNTPDVLQNSNLMVIQAVDGLPETDWDIPGACGEWSVKDIIAHFASYEQVILDVLTSFREGEPTPYVLHWVNQPDAFNVTEVEKRKYLTAQQVMDEYQNLQVQATSLLMQIPADGVQQRGTMPWYRKECCLADFIDLIYAHAREHCMQIALFRQRPNLDFERGASTS